MSDAPEKAGGNVSETVAPILIDKLRATKRELLVSRVGKISDVFSTTAK